MKKLASHIGNLIKDFQEQLKAHLPYLEMEVKQIITDKSTDANKIENYLDTILSLTHHGVGDDLYIQLLEYYKTVDEKGAKFYWEEYDGLED